MRRIGLDARALSDGAIGRYIGELVVALPEASGDAFAAFVRAADERQARRTLPQVEIIPMYSKRRSPLEYLEFRTLLRSCDLDLYHATQGVVPWGIDCALAVTLHHVYGLRFATEMKEAQRAVRLAREIADHASLILVPSEAARTELTAAVGDLGERIAVVPHAAPQGYARVGAVGDAEVEAFLRRLGMEGNYILTVTDGLPHKGLDILVDALRDLPDVRLVLAGQGSDRPNVFEILSHSGIPEERVRVLGAVSERELVLAHRGAVCAAIPSLFEEFGGAALEALASGVPVVSSDAGALVEVVGDAGAIVPAGDVASLRDALYRIAFEIDPAQREEIVRGGVERSRDFTWERTARATLAAYDRVLGPS